MKSTVSTINPQPRTPLLVLTYGDERVIINTPDTYEELEHATQMEFGLGDQKLVFSTSDLDICEEYNVRIQKSAWDVVRSMIGRISVTDGPPKASTSNHVLPRLSATACYSVRREPLQVEEPEPLTANQEEESLSSASGTSVPGASAPNPSNAINSLPSPHSTRSSNHSQHQAPSPEPLELRPESDHDEYTSYDMRSPNKRHAQRRLVSDDEGGSDHDMGEPEAPEGQNGRDAPMAASEDVPMGHDGNIGPDSQCQWQSGVIPKVKEEPISTRNRMSRRESISGGLSSRNDDTTAAQEEMIENTQGQLPTVGVSEEKLLVNIQHRPSKQQSMFKTKGSTRVFKVLNGVCKSFGLDYQSARLMLIVVMEEDDERFEHLFGCDRDDTMARVGAKQDSRFVIEGNSL